MSKPERTWSNWVSTWFGSGGTVSGLSPGRARRSEPTLASEGPLEVRRARELIAAVDAGGLPLNPAIVNQIGRALGLDVSSKAPVAETVERIRQALVRAAG